MSDTITAGPGDLVPGPKCPICLQAVTQDALSCAHCAAAYHKACWPATGCVVAGCAAAPPAAAPFGTSTVFDKLLHAAAMLFVVGGFAYLLGEPRYHRPRARSLTRACYANQKTVVGAMEMYNLDKNTKRTTLDAAFFLSLKSGGYLQSIPQDPGEGPGTSGNYKDTSANNGIKCVLHGSIQ
jgi:hypothetical protein